MGIKLRIPLGNHRRWHDEAAVTSAPHSAGRSGKWDEITKEMLLINILSNRTDVL
jgi:hypothetical protein